MITDFAKYLVALRESRGMTQHALARRTPMDATYLNRIEKGKVKPPGADKLLGVIDALRLSHAEARRLVELAGYDPVILERGASLAFSAPHVDHPLWQRLRALMQQLSPPQQEQCLIGFITIVEALTDASGSTLPPQVKRDDGEPT
jgi:transcriptional regulator with XRE-family HTH domain